MPGPYLLGVDEQGAAILLRSQWPAPVGPHLCPHQESHPLHVFPNVSLPMILKLRVEVDAFEVRICDPLGEPVLEWRCEMPPEQWRDELRQAWDSTPPP